MTSKKTVDINFDMVEFEYFAEQSKVRISFRKDGEYVFHSDISHTCQGKERFGMRVVDGTITV